MKRLIVLTAVLCVMISMTACASKSRRSRVIETDAQQPAATSSRTETTSATEEKTEDGTLQFDEELDEALIGIWKYTYDDDLDAYYVIDEDHTMMSMIDLSGLMFIKNGKLVLGEDDPSSTYSFKEKNGHLISKVEKTVLLDIKPKEGADTEEVQGDFELFESILLPQEEPGADDSESDEEDAEGEEDDLTVLRSILRFMDDRTYLIDLGVCYSAEEQLIFLSKHNRLVMDYSFDEDDPDALFVTDEEGDKIRLERSEYPGYSGSDDEE